MADVERGRQDLNSSGTNTSTRPFFSDVRSNIRTVRKVPARLLLSYVLDWVVIIAIFAAGGGLNFVTPRKRPFSLLDLSISYPFIPESISVTTLVLVALVAPAVVIAVVVLLFVPGRTFNRRLTRAQVISLKLWELEKGLAGLGLATATAFFVGQGLKQINGKPRPDCLARCQPDLANIAAHVVGGYGQDLSSRWTLVAATICMNPDQALVDEGFRSFPSGHSTWSWSGLLYLSLFLCSKFAISIPYLPLRRMNERPPRTQTNDVEMLPLHGNPSSSKPPAGPAAGSVQARESPAFDLRQSAASPPNYLVVIAFVPIAAALYICSTRYSEYWHHGFDIISGSIIGIIAAWASFRWYHLPLGRGGGWAWGARHPDKAFGVGVGVGNYAGQEL